MISKTFCCCFKVYYYYFVFIHFTSVAAYHRRVWLKEHVLFERDNNIFIRMFSIFDVSDGVQYITIRSQWFFFTGKTRKKETVIVKTEKNWKTIKTEWRPSPSEDTAPYARTRASRRRTKYERADRLREAGHYRVRTTRRNRSDKSYSHRLDTVGRLLEKSKKFMSVLSL